MRTSSLLPTLIRGVVLVTFAAAPAAAATRVAVMPLGSGALLPSVRDSLEGDLRASVEKLDGIELQPAAETQAHIREAGENGLDLTTCPASRDDCALRIAVLADVDDVVTFSVEEVGDRLLLRGGFLGADGKTKRHIAGELITPQRDNGVMMKAFVARLVKGEGRAQNLPFLLKVEPAGSVIHVDGAPATIPPDALLWLLPGNHTLHIEAPEHAPLDRLLVVHEDGDTNELVLALPPSETPVPFYVGLATAGVGTVLALGAGAVATFLEIQLEGGQISNASRPVVLTAGRTSIGIVAGGAVLVGAGAAVAMWPAP